MPVVQTSLSVVLSLFIISFFILVALRPTLTTIAGLNKTIDESESTLKKLENKARTLQTISNQWDENAQYLGVVNSAIPIDGAQYKELTNSLEAAAILSGSRLTSLTLGPVLTYSSIADPYSGKGRVVVKVPLSMRVSGGFSSIEGYLKQIARMDRLVGIDSLAFSRDTQKNNGVDTGISFNISGYVYYLANDKVLEPILGTGKGK